MSENRQLWWVFLWFSAQNVDQVLLYTMVYKLRAQRYCGFLNFGSKLTLSQNLYFFRPFFYKNYKRWPKFDLRFVIKMINLLKTHIRTESPTTYCRVMTSQSSDFDSSTFWCHNSAISRRWLSTAVFLEWVFHADYESEVKLWWPFSVLVEKKVKKSTNFIIGSTLTRNFQTDSTAVVEVLYHCVE